MISAILAASLTFTATATGVEKEVPVEFVFAGSNTDRDYESMFLLDGTIDEFCSKLEGAGLPRGIPTDVQACRLWPVGCTLRFEPALTNFISCSAQHAPALLAPVYTGGTRLKDGSCEANTNMPASVFSTYLLAQSPVVPNGTDDQGAVYGAFKPLKKMKKGERVTFTVSWDERTMPRSVHQTFTPVTAAEVFKRLRDESEKGEVDALVGFADEMTVAEATAAANALATVDSARVKINGVTNIFYRSFLPLVKWLDRKERLVQPFELTLGDADELVFINEDWSVDGPDPKLTLVPIPFEDAAQHERTTTCFIFATPETRLSRIREAMAKMKGSKVQSWYVFMDNKQSLHKTDCAK